MASAAAQRKLGAYPDKGIAVDRATSIQLGRVGYVNVRWVVGERVAGDADTINVVYVNAKLEIVVDAISAHDDVLCACGDDHARRIIVDVIVLDRDVVRRGLADAAVVNGEARPVRTRAVLIPRRIGLG